MVESAHIDEFGRALEVHHIRKARNVDDAKKRNAKSNLVTLCTPCHREIEKMAPLLPDGVASGLN